MYSVGIPVRNEVNTIEDTINSVLNQSLEPTEVLVCVNGSTDGSLDLVSRIAENNPKVKLLESEPGKPNAWHKINSESSDKYLMMIDGDVLINHIAGEKLLEKFEKNSDLSLVAGAISYFKPENKTFYEKVSTSNDEVVTLPLYVSGSLYMYDKDNLKLNSEKIGVSILPLDIINEDNYLGKIARKSNTYDSTIDAYSRINPINNFVDWYNMTLRVMEGEKQIVGKYENLRINQDSSDKALNKVNRFFEIESNLKRIGATGFFVLRQLMKIGFKYDMLTSLDGNLWKETKSTKISFPYKNIE